METKTLPHYDYQRIKVAIEYIQSQYKQHPSLEEIAEKVHLSPFHFQRLFTVWAGVSPKQFIQFLSLNYAKSLLKKEENTLFKTSLETGLSGPARLHDLFIKIEGMTPGEYKNGGENLEIEYSIQSSPFGSLLIANTKKGICHISFLEEGEGPKEILGKLYPNANLKNKTNSMQEMVHAIFDKTESRPEEIKLHIKGTPFQIKVWEALLKIPAASLVTYSDIAGRTGSPSAQRAVGTAIGANPVAFLIPCHRVIRNSGELGGYHWGLTRKSAIIGWEAAQWKVQPFREENYTS